MSAGVADARAASAGAPAWSAAWIAAAALLAVALAVQIGLGAMADVSWLILCDERWLNGDIPYRDFIEINPPASLLLYLPPVAAARALGLRPELCVAVYGFASVAAALALSRALVGRGVGPSVGLAALVALAVLPGETFCERDHLAAVFGFPLLAATLARAERRAPPLALALLAGAAAGAMAAIKPPYALIGLALALYLVGRLGWRAALRAPEYYAAAAVGVAYVVCVPAFFPHYVADVMPVGVETYVPARESLGALVVSPGAMLFLMIGLTAALAGRRGDAGPGFAVAGLATLAAGIGYFLQGKGWVYQAAPAAMFATLAGGFALRGQGPRAVALAGGGLAAAICAPLLNNIGAGWAAGMTAALALDIARTRACALDLDRLSPLALAAAIGVACGVCTIERPPTPDLEQALLRLGPGLTLATLSEDMGLAFPLARRIGAQWVLRRNSLFVTSDVRRIVSRQPGLSARLTPFAQAERDEVLADIAAHRPDAILVGPTGTALHAELFADPRVPEALAGYARVAEEKRPGYAIELWLRRDRTLN